MPQRSIDQVRGWRLHFGPQHPAAHGILKLTISLRGEVFKRVDPEFGLLHRGSEKLIETRTATQALPYFDRFDYVANLFHEHAYCLALEGLHPRYAEPLQLHAVRTAFDELSRLLNHLLTLSATCLDLNAMGPIFWAFEERERIMELCERASGARMHTALYQPHRQDSSFLTGAFVRDCGAFLLRCARSLAGAFLGLLNNRVLKVRLSGVGQLAGTRLLAHGVTGVLLRSSGVARDLRLEPGRRYGLYGSLAFHSFTGRRGDNFDRFLLRVKEAVEAFRVLAQVLAVLAARRQATPAVGAQRPVSLAPAQGRYSGMEELIAHFKASSEGAVLYRGVAYGATESPKGEVGVLVVATGLPRLLRVKLRAPVAHNLHLIPVFGGGMTIADFVATFCSLDVVLGEIDR